MPNDDQEEYLRPPTPPVDPKVSELVSHISGPASSKVDKDDDEGNLSDDNALFDELEKEEDDVLSGLRERRMEALKTELTRAKDMREQEHGRYTEVSDEKQVIQICAKESKCVVHFFHRDFKRCQIMDKHLELIAPHHFKTRFFRVFVENIPWLVEKLQIKVLPCVICFIGGAAKDRLIGFEELGNDDAFTTTALEMRLAQIGVIETRAKKSQLVSQYAGRSIRDKDAENEDDWNSDD